MQKEEVKYESQLLKIIEFTTKVDIFNTTISCVKTKLTALKALDEELLKINEALKYYDFLEAYENDLKNIKTKNLTELYEDCLALDSTKTHFSNNVDDKAYLEETSRVRRIVMMQIYNKLATNMKKGDSFLIDTKIVKILKIIDNDILEMIKQKYFSVRNEVVSYKLNVCKNNSQDVVLGVVEQEISLLENVFKTEEETEFILSLLKNYFDTLSRKSLLEILNGNIEWVKKPLVVYLNGKNDSGFVHDI